MNRVGLRGKVCYFTRKDIKKIDKNFCLTEFDHHKLYDLLEEYMLNNGFVLFDNDFEFTREITVNGWHEIRYSCMILKGNRRNKRFILKEVGIQYWHLI